jgi:hypothetical protein
LLLLALSLWQFPAFAAAPASPVLSEVLPRGGQRGTQVVADFTGARLDKALGVIFGASDLAAEPLAPAEIDKALAWLKAADGVAVAFTLAAPTRAAHDAAYQGFRTLVRTYRRLPDAPGT